MRNELKKLYGERLRFVGTFDKEGIKASLKIRENGIGDRAKYPKTILLLNVKDAKTNIELCDHLWVNYSKAFENLGTLSKGDLIFFDARVTEYFRGKGMCTEQDFKISLPTKLSIKKRKNGWWLPEPEYFEEP